MELTQGVRIDADVSDAEAGLDRLGRSAAHAGEGIETAGKKAVGASHDMNQLERGLNQLERALVRIGAEFLLFEGLKKGLEGGDAFRDLQHSIDALTGSIGSGAKAMDFFEEVQMRTRSTTMELAEMYKKLSAQNLGVGGFNTEQLMKFTVELDQAATAAHVTSKEMTEFWRAVKQGESRIPQNVLRQMGLNKEDAKDLEKVKAKIEELAEAGEKMGLTFSSALKKIGDAFVIAFAKGEGKDPTESYKKLIDAFTKPEVLEGISRVANGVIKLMGIIPGLANTIIGAVQIAFGLLISDVGRALQWVTGAVSTVLQKLADASPAFGPAGKLKSWFQAGATGAAGASGFFEGLKDQGMADLKDGAKNLELGLAGLLHQFDGTTSSSNAFNDSLKTGATHLTTAKDKTHDADVAARKLKASLDEATRAQAAFDQLKVRMEALFNIDEGESPLDRKLKALKKGADEIAITARKAQEDATHKVGLGMATGDLTMMNEGLKRWNEYEELLKRLPGELQKASAAQIFNAAKEEAKGFLDEIIKVNDTTREMGDNLKNALAGFENPNLNIFAQNIASGMKSLIDQMNAAVTAKMNERTSPTFSAEERIKQADEIRRVYKDVGVQFIKDNELAAKKWADGFTAPLASVFTDLATNEGKNFGQIAGAMFTNTVSKGMTKVAEILGSAVLQAFPGATPPQQGKDESNADFKIRSAKATEQQQAIISGFQAAVGGIGHELQMFKDAQGGKQTSVLANTVSMAAVGASIGSAINVGWGTIIGAIVGAIIGAVTAAIANAQAKAALPYAEYGVKDGKFYLSPMTGLEDHFKNITQKQYNDLMQQGTAAINSMTTGYIGLLLKFPMDVIASLGNLSLSSLNFKPTMYQQGGPGSPTTTPGMIWNPTVDWHAMQTFSQDLDNWLKNTMPKQIAALFKDRVSSAFVSMGMTVDDFNKIWTELDGLDPKAALAVLNDLADAFVAMRKVTDYAKNIGGGFANALASGTTLNASGEAMRGVTEFQQSVISAQEGIIKLAIAVATLPLAESAAAAVKLGQSLEQLQGNLTTFLNQVLAITKSISAEIQDLKYNDALGAATTNKQKTSILEARYKSDIAHADNWQKEGLSPDQVRAYIEDALKTAGQIRDLDPKGREAWYLKQIDQIDFWQQSIFKSIGEAAIAQTNAIMAQVSGILTGAGTIFADAMSALSASALAAANALNVISGVTPAAAASRTSSITTTGQSPAAAASYASTTSSSSTARNSTSQSVVVTVDDPSGFVQNVRAGRQTR